jgi:hypothetical protein
LWCYSAYGFESANGCYLKLFHGTQSVTQQIISSFLIIRQLQDMSARLMMNASDSVVKMFGLLMGSDSDKLKKTVRIDSAVLLGCPLFRAASVNEKLIVENVIHAVVSPVFELYDKVIVNGQVYNIIRYTTAVKRTNAYVLLNDGTSGKIVDECETSRW